MKHTVAVAARIVGPFQRVRRRERDAGLVNGAGLLRGEKKRSDV